ncbi:MAG: hypothetical protein LBL80_03100 [Ruminococcus sp.]|jgi:hypothetical protein|nr:hypothetical protein [Ruminococcus sp.]
MENEKKITPEKTALPEETLEKISGGHNSTDIPKKAYQRPLKMNGEDEEQG